MLPLSRVNVTGLLRRLQLNIQVFKIIKSPWRNHGGFAQIFSCCPKKLSGPKFGGAAAPLALPPRPVRLWVVPILGDPGAVKRDDRVFVVTVYYTNFPEIVNCHHEQSIIPTNCPRVSEDGCPRGNHAFLDTWSIPLQIKGSHWFPAGYPNKIEK